MKKQHISSISLDVESDRWHIICDIITQNQSIAMNHCVQSSYLLLTVLAVGYC